MRALFLLAILLLSAAACGPERAEVVTGFHGYPWGTRAADIPELAGTEPVAEKEGLVVHSAEVTLQGRKGLAGFYFHPETGELVEGAYAFPLTLEECEAAFDEFANAVAEAYPALERVDRLARREGRDREVYASDCEFFVYNAHREVWRVDFNNPRGPGDGAGLWLEVTGRSPSLTLVYRGAKGEAWLEEWRENHEEEPERPDPERHQPPPVRKSA